MQTRVDESQNYDVALKKLDPPQKKKKTKKYTASIYMKFQKIIYVTQNQWLPRVAG